MYWKHQRPRNDPKWSDDELRTLYEMAKAAEYTIEEIKRNLPRRSLSSVRYKLQQLGFSAGVKTNKIVKQLP